MAEISIKLSESHLTFQVHSNGASLPRFTGKDVERLVSGERLVAPAGS